MLVEYKIYRWIKIVFGWKSFVKYSDDFGDPTYVIFRGSSKKFVSSIEEMGFRAERFRNDPPVVFAFTIFLIVAMVALVVLTPGPPP